MTTFDITQTANPAQSKKVLFDVQHAVAIITLNDPTSLNALHSDMIAELSAALDKALYDAQVKVIVLTGAGRAFCSGGDIREMVAAFVYGAAAMGVVGFVVAVVLAIFRQRYRKGLLIVLVVLGVLLSLPVSFLLVVGIGANKSLATAWGIVALNALTAGGALGVAAWRALPR